MCSDKLKDCENFETTAPATIGRSKGPFKYSVIVGRVPLTVDDEVKFNKILTSLSVKNVSIKRAVGNKSPLSPKRQRQRSGAPFSRAPTSRVARSSMPAMEKQVVTAAHELTPLQRNHRYVAGLE
ncbi:hypothetical protein EVAR_79140_1 [Eumeta japonica]|uniref:Uncharacterized protein n=1 Tax=Eumeta variegata TaxID=151549 RepID=A0A4C1USZ7_EUMVA|nr:hypothetical protein EVAR_79140_1 [Eumeta japonica]